MHRPSGRGLQTFPGPLPQRSGVAGAEPGRSQALRQNWPLTQMGSAGLPTGDPEEAPSPPGLFQEQVVPTSQGSVRVQRGGG